IAEFFPQIVRQTLAAIGTTTGGTHFGATSGADRLVDRQDDLRYPCLARGARQAIAAAWTAYALDQAGPAQTGEQLFQIGQRYFLPGSDIRQRHRLCLGVPRQIDHCHHGITTLGAELHSILLMPVFTGSSCASAERS